MRSPSRNTTVTACCGACNRPLPTGNASRQWCSDACRQAAWRRRHQNPTPTTAELPTGRSRRANTIYQCPECETKLLGEQRCEDCASFMRRLGPGGLCPCCDEPITIDELLQP
jgi:hypothetical protein